MAPFLKNKGFILLVIAFLVSLTPFFSKLFLSKETLPLLTEQFDPSTLRLNSMSKMIAYCDSVYKVQGPQNFDTAVYTSIASNLIRKRFYHGTLNYNISENWIANIAGKLFWSHLSSIVIADDILKHPLGLCSQQTIVFMEILRQKKITLRSVGLGYKEGPGHFLCEIHYNNDWHLHDVSIEPDWSKIVSHHKSLQYYLTYKDSLFAAYQQRLSKETFNKILEKVKYGEINVLPAKNMTSFHKVTFYFIYLLPAFLLVLIIRSIKKQKMKKLDTILPIKSDQKQTRPLSHSNKIT